MTIIFIIFFASMNPFEPTVSPNKVAPKLKISILYPSYSFFSIISGALKYFVPQLPYILGL